MKWIIIQLFVFAIISSCQTQNTSTATTEEKASKFIDTNLPDVIEPVEKTKEEWKTLLSKQEYYVLREKGTERSFTGPFWNNKSKGVYVCGGCGLPLFDSQTKFTSGTGWPSFYQPIDEKVIKEDEDFLIGYRRVEVMCSRCEGHLGHVFPDGPKPTGLRYCLNGAALDFIATEASADSKNE